MTCVATLFLIKFVPLFRALEHGYRATQVSYLVFLKIKLKRKQTAVNANPAVASMEYIISIAM